MSQKKIPTDIFADWPILIVDDEPDSLLVATHILKFYGGNVVTAENGQEGFERAKEVLPRFIISDLSMPVIDGWTMLTMLRQHPPTENIPVIALSAHAMVGDREKAIEAGFNNYIPKPLSAQTFLQTLLRILGEIPHLKDDLQF